MRLCKVTAIALALAIPAPALAAEPAAAPAPAAAAAPTPAAAATPEAPVRKRRQPPPPVIPEGETKQAEELYRNGRYVEAVAQAKAALNKNERYTPAMLVMAKSYFKLRKYEWMKKLWETMQANGASDAEKSEVYQLLAFLEIDRQNTPGAIENLKKATELRADNAILWNNLGAQYLTAKNYRDAQAPLERAVQLQPSFAKAHLNLGDAYRGLKMYDRAETEYKRALDAFPNYADAVFNLGILYLDADKMPNQDKTMQMNTAISYFQKYRTMMGSTIPAADPSQNYITEAQENITKEQKRIERQRKAEEREKARAAKKAADDAKKAQAAGATPAPGATPTPAPAAAPTPGDAANAPMPPN